MLLNLFFCKSEFVVIIVWIPKDLFFKIFSSSKYKSLLNDGCSVDLKIIWFLSLFFLDSVKFIELKSLIFNCIFFSNSLTILFLSSIQMIVFFFKWENIYESDSIKFIFLTSGEILIFSILFIDNCVSGSKIVIISIVSSDKTILHGFSSENENTSIIYPRIENSPGLVTNSTFSKSFSYNFSVIILVFIWSSTFSWSTLFWKFK